MNQKIRINILMRLQNNNPNPREELNCSSPFEVLISTLLSAQSTDTRVNKATCRLYKLANTAPQLLKLGLDKLKEHIKTIGLHNTKAKNIINICHILLEKHGGNVPNTRETLESLPGVGRKTANIVLNTSFNLPTIAVDRHIFRFCNRSNFAIGKNVREVENKLLKYVPKKFQIYCHKWFVLHGRYTCLSKKPKCETCLIKDLCEFKKKIIS
ncbi:endonuclease III [Candidatus Erwinia haradaeae]|uniref:Endonuclease III n=1 Tax=Candidatus Erwinia haradaeae TaxID=1922217 RepID=A0A451D2K0_9GAMM|nr:endonuclease III [Candidatus Erwinia haradaeae]VFP79859.1 Endonuclease III [Candidatus Erwinia haradaeae]